jgi:hypothetical protein
MHQWTLMLAGGNLATGRATHAKQVLGKVPGKEKCTGRGGCGLKIRKQDE